MAESIIAPDLGGFLLSPPASSVATSVVPSSYTLPHPRSSPLRPGAAKWSTFIRYVDTRILHIQRRFAKRSTPIVDGLSNVARDEADSWGDVKGYSSMKDACADVRELIKVIWASGTPSLQIAYLINLGSIVGNFVSGMPPNASALFPLLDMLDRAFASLLQGRDLQTGEVLPGLGGPRGVSGTEKVRIRSLVERTRVGVVEAFGSDDFNTRDVEEVEESSSTIDGDDELVLEGESVLEEDENDESWDMSIARVYDHTVIELGDTLEQPNIGIITESRW